MNRRYAREVEQKQTLSQRLASVGELERAKEVVHRCGSTIEAIATPSKFTEHVKARHAVIHLLLERDFSFAHIGRIMGIHHTSVMYAYRKLASCAAEDE